MNLNRYRILEDGSFTFHTFKEGQNFNQNLWLENDGRFEKKLEAMTGTAEDVTEYSYQVDVWYYTYYNEDGTPDLVKEQELADIKAYKELKQAKELAKSVITVTTTNGNTFDGNSEARNNMSDAILASEIVGQTETMWKLANNEVKLITLSEIREAHALAIKECGRIVLAETIEEI